MLLIIHFLSHVPHLIVTTVKDQFGSRPLYQSDFIQWCHAIITYIEVPQLGGGMIEIEAGEAANQKWPILRRRDRCLRHLSYRVIT